MQTIYAYANELTLNEANHAKKTFHGQLYLLFQLFQPSGRFVLPSQLEFLNEEIGSIKTAKLTDY